MHYWLVKSEPESYSIDDLKRDKRTSWTGVRNYQARNYMRDGMKLGDLVLYYHSRDNPAIVGIAKVVKESYPDATQFDSKSQYFDETSKKDDPRWMLVDLAFETKFDEPLALAALRSEKELAKMVLLQKGSRLSVQPVTEPEFQHVVTMAGNKDAAQKKARKSK
jgi:predicted RNA-binding protein with PUA-like domain